MGLHMPVMTPVDRYTPAVQPSNLKLLLQVHLALPMMTGIVLQIAPAHEGLELGVGDSILIKVGPASLLLQLFLMAHGYISCFLA